MVRYIDGVLVQPKHKGAGVDRLKILGIVRGFTPFTYLKQIKSGQIRLIENNNIAGLLQQVQKDRVDGAYFNIAVAKYYLEKMDGRVNVVFDPKLPHAKSTRHLSSWKDHGLIEKFDTFLTKNKSAIAKLKRKYKVEEEL